MAGRVMLRNKIFFCLMLGAMLAAVRKTGSRWLMLILRRGRPNC